MLLGISWPTRLRRLHTCLEHGPGNEMAGSEGALMVSASPAKRPPSCPLVLLAVKGAATLGVHGEFLGGVVGQWECAPAGLLVALLFIC